MYTNVVAIYLLKNIDQKKMCIGTVVYVMIIFIYPLIT